MSPSEDHERFSEDLQEVAEVLRERRPQLGPLELDRIKLRAMSGASRSSSSRQGGFSMRSRMTTLLTVGFLAVGTGGALALSGGGGGLGLGGDHAGSASYHQYRPKCDRHNRDKRHCHPKCPPHQELSGYGCQPPPPPPPPPPKCKRHYSYQSGHCKYSRHGAGNGNGASKARRH